VPDVEAHRLSAAVFVLGTAALVLAVGGLAALVTWQLHPHPKPPCRINCPPPEADTRAAAAEALREERTFTSSSFHFSVDYSTRWSVVSSGSAGALFHTTHGLMEFLGSSGAASSAQLISDRVGRFDSTRLPDIRAIGPVLGARVGSQEGQGELYAATLLPSSGGGAGLLVRIAIIASHRGNLNVVATVLLPYDQSSGQLVGASEADYALTEFRWPGE
jgi:hypothetical protein